MRERIDMTCPQNYGFGDRGPGPSFQGPGPCFEESTLPKLQTDDPSTGSGMATGSQLPCHIDWSIVALEKISIGPYS